MPKKIRQLKAMLRQAGWELIPGAGGQPHEVAASEGGTEGIAGWPRW